ncbi:MAG: hypothetical protein DMG22_17740 [Acidobacteria bacterium]|nr:MAG: hypothetical protein DMG22_17740 [Acidobacteriota bacterium]
MSSGEPASSDAAGPSFRPEPPAGRRRVVWAAAALGFLAAFAFWVNAPQPHFVPAPLDAAGPVCSRTARVFTPTNATEIPGLDAPVLSPKEMDRVIYRANMEACRCGCKLSLVACRINYPSCATSPEQLKKLAEEARARARTAR